MKMTIKNLLAKLTLIPSSWRWLGGGLLLFIGSAGLMAQTTDPFGDVDEGLYDNSMNITGYVRMVSLVNGQWEPVSNEVLGNETVVAVYCGDELRGKCSPKDYDEDYTSMLMMTVYGNNKGQPLYFKVFTQGHVIEVDQGLTFTSNGRVGKVISPYYINLPVPITTTFSSEGWATTCLPFDAEVPEGVTLWDATAIENGELVLKEVNADVLPKDIPVMLRADTGSAPTCEWLARVVDEDKAEATASLFDVQSSILKGTTEPKQVTANSVLTMGHSVETGELGFWIFSGEEVPANRVYIADFPSGSRGARIGIGDIVTAVNHIMMPSQQTEQVYDLHGRRVNSPSSMVNGLVITNGRKYLNNRR